MRNKECLSTTALVACGTATNRLLCVLLEFPGIREFLAHR